MPSSNPMFCYFPYLSRNWVKPETEAFQLRSRHGYCNTVIVLCCKYYLFSNKDKLVQCQFAWELLPSKKTIIRNLKRIWASYDFPSKHIVDAFHYTLT